MTTWVMVDLETTGLNPRTDVICEMGFSVLKSSATRQGVIEMGFTFQTVVNGDYQADILLDLAESPEGSDQRFVYEMHEKSGLLPLLDETRPIDNAQATDAAYDFLTNRIMHDPDDKPILVGSSLAFDRSFLKENCPELDNFFNYRMIDVSSFKETFRRVQPSVLESVPKPRKLHRVVPDMEDSLQELNHYLPYFRAVL
jgi:oligoribonuclease